MRPLSRPVPSTEPAAADRSATMAAWDTATVQAVVLAMSLSVVDVVVSVALAPAPSAGLPSCRVAGVAGLFSCDAGRRIPDSLRCDWVKDCNDGADEADCPACGCDAFRCASGHCRRKVDRCDGKKDCPDNSDELDCPQGDRILFACGDGSVILQAATCDGVPDCADQADEDSSYCARCSPDAFRCSGFCWRLTRRCDGVVDCAEGEDEADCAAAGTGTLPGDNPVKDVKDGDAVVIPLLVSNVLLLLVSVGALAGCFMLRRRLRYLTGSSQTTAVIFTKDSPLLEGTSVSEPQAEGSWQTFDSLS